MRKNSEKDERRDLSRGTGGTQGAQGAPDMPSMPRPDGNMTLNNAMTNGHSPMPGGEPMPQGAPLGNVNMSAAQPAAPILPKTQDDSRVINIGEVINNGAPGMPAPVITRETVQNAQRTLLKYKAAKNRLEKRVIASEDFWKLRQWGRSSDEKSRHTPATAWLWNVIVSKHADSMDGLPEPNILPKEEEDTQEAKILTSIVPVVMAQNGFKNTYNNNMWDKLKQGTGIYGVFWDSTKLNGLGDIAIRKIDVLNCFWEPGITDIQNSRNFFVVELKDKDELANEYANIPEIRDGGLKGSTLTLSKYRYDDNVDLTDKAAVVDWYYKRRDSYGRTVVHFCKFVNDIVLFSTENSPQEYPDGLYEHGKYPFVFDPLYPVKGSPCGYGYTDICADDQIQIDELSYALVQNAKLAARPRFFSKMDGGINEEEFADWSNDIVHVQGGLDEEHVRMIEVPLLNGNFHNLLEWKVNEIKETSGNRDVNNGSTSASVTAASAIAALQEASGKTSRDFLKGTYDAYEQIVKIVIELIRQFYTEERKFRIIGTDGAVEFVNYQNENLRKQQTPIILPDGTSIPGAQISERLPDFDIEVTAQKNVAYTKAAQNELAIQFYNAGFFSPQNADQALAAVNMMDFAHKDAVIQKISENQTLYDQLAQYMQLAMALASKYEPALAQQLAATMQGGAGGGAGSLAASAGASDETAGSAGAESAVVSNARKRTQESTQV